MTAAAAGARDKACRRHLQGVLSKSVVSGFYSDTATVHDAFAPSSHFCARFAIVQVALLDTHAALVKLRQSTRCVYVRVCSE